MLTITINDDRSVTLHSDDENAENLDVGAAFEDIEFHDLARVWNDAPFDSAEGFMEVTFDAKDTDRVFDALDSWPDFQSSAVAIDEARAAYKNGATSGVFAG